MSVLERISNSRFFLCVTCRSLQASSLVISRILFLFCYKMWCGAGGSEASYAGDSALGGAGLSIYL